MRFYRHTIPGAIVLLCGIEAGVILAAPACGAWLAGGSIPWQTPSLWVPQELTYATVMLASLVALGLYQRRQRARAAGILARLVVAVAGGSALVGLVSYLLPIVAVPRMVLAAAAGVILLTLGALRLVFDRFSDETLFKRNVLVVGTGRRALSISRLRRRSDQRGFRIAGFLHLAEAGPLVPADKFVDVRGTLLEYCRGAQIDEIVVAMDDRRRNFPVAELLDCKLAGVKVTDVVDFLEQETGRVSVDVLNPSWIIFADGFERHLWHEVAERAFDLGASSALLFVTWPVILLVILAIKAEDGIRAPVFYRQRRVGAEGRVFTLLKFRSMSVDAERDGARWAQRSDPRVTRVGAFMRKTRIDELPQIMNVFAGDMCFVGPRPERPEFVSELEERIPYYRERHAIKPGITGWAQLCYPYGSSDEDAMEKLQYDLYYVKNRSLLFDLVILLQTVEVILWRKGSR